MRSGRSFRTGIDDPQPATGSQLGAGVELVYWSAAMSVPVVDPFGRRITYLRVSVTDRCDFRCVYCMAEDMTFLP